MKRIELLAPVGDRASFDAALNNGADAVYFGAAAFGARAGAGFDDAAVREMLRLAHLQRRRVYVTVNTLLKEHEMADAIALVEKLDAMQADAVIIQDLGLAAHLREHLPHLPLHASTQMSIHNALGARLLKDLGFTRLVLARECGLDAIAEVATSGIETEVFVHGALCVSVSGQCLLSSQIGGRSGNRGRCAQPCRLSYRYRGREGAWLSPRDLSTIDHIPALLQAGVGGLKIEGRLKRAEYVAIVTRIYRKALDAALEGRPHAGIEQEKAALLQIFSRGGFTQGHAFGQTDAQKIYPDQVSHEGVALGAIISSRQAGGAHQAQLIPVMDVHHGDMLRILSTPEQEMIYSGPTVPAGALLGIRHHRPAQAGDAVRRLIDEEQLKQARLSIEAGLSPIPLKARLSLSVGRPAELWLSDGHSQVLCRGAIPQAALTAAISEESSRKAIGKTGDSPFVIADYAFEGENCFMPVGQLNALRRNALEAMERQRIADYPRQLAPPFAAGKPKVARETLTEGLYVRTGDPSTLKALAEAGADCLLYAPQDLTSDKLAEDLALLRPQDYLCLPKQLDDQSLRELAGLAEELKLQLLIDNVSQLGLPLTRPPLAGSGIPVWNTLAAEWLAGLGCKGFVLSRELSREDAEPLQDAAIPLLLPVYGRAEVMLLNHCPERSFRGLSGSQTGCHLCERGEGSLGQALEDRLDARYPLAPQRQREGCQTSLLFHTPLHLSRKAFGKRWLVAFHVEEPHDMLAITRYYAALLRGENQLPDLGIPYDAGRLDSGVQ